MKGRAVPPPCPDCGAPLALRGRFCRGCGWDADLTESEDSYLDGVDVPQGYAREAEEETRQGSGRRIFLWIAALLALAGFAWSVLHR